MADGINPLGIPPVAGTQPATQPVTTQPAAGTKFMDLLLDSLEQVNQLQTEADNKVQALYSGESDDLAGVLAAANKAGIAFDLLMEVRNKLIDAYREIQQIRV